jgi:hypothetical protein
MAATKVVYSTRKGRQIPSGFDHGPGALVTSQGIYETSSTQKQRLGAKLAVGDRVFRYAKSGAAILGGLLVQGATVGGATTTLQTTQPLVVAAKAGDSRLYVCALTTAQTADKFADGWVSIYDATLTSSYLFRIKGNSALATTGTTSYLELYDEIPVDLAVTTTQLEFIANPYAAVITLAHATTLTGPVLGGTPVYVASGYYFWLQTYGPWASISSAALDFDEYVTMSDSTVGQVKTDNASANTQIIGSALAVGTAAESCILFLTVLN